MTERQDLPAGRFSTWLRRTRDAQVDDSGADVPCGECIACCRSSYFIHVAPEESQTLARIPGELLFPATGLPKGNVVLGYDENGRCPMLQDDACSIYEHRPLTCRTYDCRVFAAAGIEADRAEIAQRARCWKFSYAAEEDREQHAAVQAAARFLREHADCFPGEGAPDDPTQVALLAIKVYEVFLEHGEESDKAGRASSDAGVARAVVEANEKFEAGRSTLRVDPTRADRPIPAGPGSDGAEGTGHSEEDRP
jgi:Fe-S-cluster containining protein